MSRTQVVIGNLLNSKIKKQNQSIDASHASGFNTLHASGYGITKQLQENSKKYSSKDPSVGKTSTSDKEFKVQSFEGTILFQIKEHTKIIGITS